MWVRSGWIYILSLVRSMTLFLLQMPLEIIDFVTQQSRQINCMCAIRCSIGVLAPIIPQLVLTGLMPMLMRHRSGNGCQLSGNGKGQHRATIRGRIPGEMLLTRVVAGGLGRSCSVALILYLSGEMHFIDFFSLKVFPH